VQDKYSSKVETLRVENKMIGKVPRNSDLTAFAGDLDHGEEVEHEEVVLPINESALDRLIRMQRS
jgi:hypothetical protein